MSRFTKWFYENWPELVTAFSFLVVICGFVFSINRSSKSSAEEIQRARTEEIVVESKIYIDGLGHLRVIRDTKRHVTCYQTNDLFCVQDSK